MIRCTHTHTHTSAGERLDRGIGGKGVVSERQCYKLVNISIPSL